MFVQDLPLHPPVEEKPERLQFVKKKALLKVHIDLLMPAQSPYLFISVGIQQISIPRLN